MSDYPPRSAAARFGVALTGPKFVWAWLDENMEPVEGEFRAHPGLSFSEQLDYNAAMSVLSAESGLDQLNLQRRLEEITKGADDDNAPFSPEEVVAKAREAAELSQEGETRRYATIVEQTLILVHPGDRDALRPHLVAGNAADVRALRTHLVDVVINRTHQAVAAVASVDPT